MMLFDLIGKSPTAGKPLTVVEFEKATKKKAPYYQNEGGATKHYAVCPECRNPIIIINLYTDNSRIEGEAEPAPLHARHVSRSINGVANYDEEKYKNCSLANPVAFTCKDRRAEGGKVSNELLQLMIQHARVIRSMISNSIGLNISDKLFKSMLTTFKSERGHLYRYVNRYNLPYAVIYLMGNKSLNFQYLQKSEVGRRMTEAINNNCDNFSVKNNKIIVTNNESDAKLEMYITNHVRNNKTGHESLVMHVEEENGGTITKVFEHKIEFDSSFFINWINKDLRSADIVNEVFQLK